MPYSAESYLLDRANIQDTVTKLCLAYDIRSPKLLADEVYASSVTVDYTEILGGEPTVHSGDAWSASVIDIIRPMTSTQHIVTSTLVHLPQPSAEVSKPDTCRAESNVLGNLVRENARGGSLMQNGGRYELELVRIQELEIQGLNPWRIRFHKAVTLWESGNWAVISPPPAISKSKA